MHKSRAKKYEDLTPRGQYIRCQTDRECILCWMPLDSTKLRYRSTMFCSPKCRGAYLRARKELDCLPTRIFHEPEVHRY